MKFLPEHYACRLDKIRRILRRYPFDRIKCNWTINLAENQQLNDQYRQMDSVCEVHDVIRRYRELIVIEDEDKA